MSVYGKVSLISSILFFAAGLIGLILELRAGDFVFYSSWGVFYLILGLTFLLFTLSNRAYMKERRNDN
ncbi:hypothetical protein EBO34_16995 [Alteribacter keqinensis]|uniref:Uncharacterized protein n=1 Tax=Alteribacter keqinensis TaxID=2483800 RepID=A0A3M7TQD3_9BACI|nr:hypothetical protein EBO34_16995 [Alteribacter keqinensis]